ncbi:MAG: hypothetical protein QOE30_1954 [Mycobacterium sp.]|jgi:hypothetical protein|nr:hypothetical protein [Mycobacterium sp.]
MPTRDGLLRRLAQPDRRVVWPSGRHEDIPVTLLDELAARPAACGDNGRSSAGAVESLP